MRPNNILSYAAIAASKRPTFLGNVLRLYMQREKIDDQALETILGCDGLTLSRLRLCRVPRSTSAKFFEEISSIAQRFSINDTVLGAIVKDVLVSAAMAKRRRPKSTYLMAARDRDEDESDESGDGDD